MSEETTGNQQETTSKRSGSSFFKILAFIVIVGVIAVGGYFLMKNGVGSIGGKAVAIVNGEKITRTVYDERYAQLAASITAQGQSATTTEAAAAIKNQTLDNLITETLILKAAEKENIKANEEAINTQLTQSKSQFADADTFAKELTAQGFTESTFRKFLTRNNIIQQYLAVHIDVSSATASQEEVTAFYNQAAANDANIPPLAEIRAQVENQIVQTKQQQLVAKFIEQLKASSVIETLI